ncbi:hypothetical protein ENSA5_60780 [Enhygromyxa salina]|uniref:Uncharacterized protein n=1 Tax=Enhygromyxa salina TaxID=215803 RepID=A0A2S9XDD2_9BACT|nr:hypothetical protein [Enhygromyxa salina]PRP90878.1 hypothetical protein ENSA5_60780 [Enhygromyxa salina]
MWSEREREELAVWADRLQAEGEPLGELVTTSLLAETLAARGHDGAQLRALRERVAELETEVRDPMVAEALAECPELELSWVHGVAVALRVVDRPRDQRLGQQALASLRRLLRSPISRFLRHVRVDVRANDWSPVHRQIPALLAEPGVLARPWSVVLGDPPRHLRRRASIGILDPCRSGGDEARGWGGELGSAWLDALVVPRRELRSLFLDTVRVELPWQPGDKATRKRAAARLAERGNDEPTTLTRLARALWDPSLRVRLQILDALPLLGADAAPFVPELLLVERGQLEWLTRVREVLDTLARNPAVVTAVALNFTVDQTRSASWLAASPLAVASLAVPRIDAMLARSDTVEAWARRELEIARRRMAARRKSREQASFLDTRNPASGPLMKRLRRWIQA